MNYLALIEISKCLNKWFCVTVFCNSQQRTGYTPPPAMATSGGTMIPRPAQAPYSPMRGGPMPPQQSVKRPSDSRPGIQQKR